MADRKNEVLTPDQQDAAFYGEAKGKIRKAQGHPREPENWVTKPIVDYRKKERDPIAVHPGDQQGG